MLPLALRQWLDTTGLCICQQEQAARRLGVHHVAQGVTRQQS